MASIACFSYLAEMSCCK